MDRRVRFRQGLSSLYLPTYDALCAELGPEWQPTDGLRTFDQQDLLWRRGRELPGPVVTNAKGGQSAHNYGCGSDWCLWDDQNQPHWPEKGDSAWQPYLQAIEKIGLRSGSEWGDWPHNEVLLSCDWPHILVAYSQGGMTAAQAAIQAAMK